MSYEFRGFIQQGWQCPVCKRVYSPTTPMCMYCCQGSYITTTGAFTTPDNRDDKDRFKDPFSDVIANAINQMSKKAEDILKGNNHNE